MFSPRVLSVSKVHKAREAEAAEKKARESFKFEYRNRIADVFKCNRTELWKAFKKTGNGSDATIYLKEIEAMCRATIINVSDARYMLGVIADRPALRPPDCDYVVYVVPQKSIVYTTFPKDSVWWYTVRTQTRMLRDVVLFNDVMEPPRLEIPILGMTKDIVTAARRSSTKCRFEASPSGWFAPMENCMYVSSPYV